MVPRLVLPLGPQRYHAERQVGRRRPSGDSLGTQPGLEVVTDTWKPAAQLDGGRQLALLLVNSADRVGFGFCDHEHAGEVRLNAVASKRRKVHAFAMTLPRVPWWKLIVPMSRRDRARLAKLDGMRAELAAVADRVRDVASRHDARAHLVRQAARASQGAMTETRAVNSTQNTVLAQAADAVVRSKQTATALDGVVETLERLAASLRGF